MMCRASPRGVQSIQMTDRVDPTLTLVATQVGDVDRQPGGHILGALEIKTTFAQSPFALRWIIGDLHAKLMYIQ